MTIETVASKMYTSSRKIMRVWLFVLIFISDSTTNGNNLDLETTAQIVASMKRIFQAECAFLLYSPGLKNVYILGQLRKLLATCNTEASLMTFQMLDLVYGEETCRNVRPLTIIVFNDEETACFLRALSTSDLTRSRWLLFLDNVYEINQFLMNVYIPFNSEFFVAQSTDHAVILNEVYRVNKTQPLQIETVGNWTPQDGLCWPLFGIYHRRSDLQGLTIRVGYFHSGSSIHKEKNIKSQPEIGFFSEVWLALEERINFTTKYLESADRNFGSLQKNGSWSGIMGMIIGKQIDIAVNSLIITAERYRFIDFTIPIFRSRQCIIIRKPEENIFKWNNILTPFSTEIWIGVSCTIMILSAFLSIVFYIWQRYAREDSVVKFNFFESFDYVYTSFCQQGCSVTPISSSCRIVCLVTKFTATILLAGYSAYIVAHLAVQRPQLPFTDFESLLEDGTYKLGVLANSSLSMLFTNTNSIILREVYEKLVAPTQLPSTYSNGLQRVCNDKKYAYMTLYEIPLTVIRTARCPITYAWWSQTRDEMAFPIAKGSPYRGIINHHLNVIRYSGILQRLFSKWYPAEEEELKKKWDSVPIDAVESIMLIPVFGVLASILIFAGECIVQRLSDLIRKRKKPKK